MHEPVTVRFWRDLDGRIRATVLDVDGTIEIQPADHSGRSLRDGPRAHYGEPSRFGFWRGGTLSSVLYQIYTLLKKRWSIE